jgi:hypothetical protein
MVLVSSQFKSYPSDGNENIEPASSTVHHTRGRVPQHPPWPIEKSEQELKLFSTTWLFDLLKGDWKRRMDGAGLWKSAVLLKISKA